MKGLAEFADQARDEDRRREMSTQQQGVETARMLTIASR